MKLVVVAASFAIMLSIAEVAVRLLPPTMLRFEYADGVFRHPREFEVDPTVNSLGFHDVEPGPRRDGVRRVLLLGDSYVQDDRHPISETPGQRLAAYLNERSSGSRYEVVSIGVGGWGQVEQARAWDQHGAQLRPDIVVTLILTFNDILDNQPKAKHSAAGQKKRIAQLRPGQTLLRRQDAPLLLFEQSRLNQLISHRLAYLLRDTGSDSIPLAYRVYAATQDDDWRQAWASTETCLRYMKRQAESRGARYVVVAASTPHGVLGAERGLRLLESAYPAMKSEQWDLDGPDRRLAEMCERLGIPFLRLEPSFREAAARGERLHFRFDGHWTKAGADLAASLMADFFLTLDTPATPAPE